MNVEAMILQQVRQIAGPGDYVTIDTPFAALPIDSLEQVELVTAVEDAFGIEISAAETTGCESLRDLSNIVLQHLARQCPVAA